MFIGAVAFGLLTTFLVQFLSDKGIQGDASIGVAFTFLFALGVVLISLYGQHVDLDLDCVLYGEIAYTPFDLVFIGDQNFGPRPLWINSTLILINLTLILLFYKQFKICAFDPEMAAAVGINVVGMHYLLMLMVSVTTVGAFESVGAILVVAMLIVPAATAYLLTDRLASMLAIAVGTGILSSIVGYYVAMLIDASIAGSIATVAGVFFTVAFLFSPQQGIVSKVMSQLQLRRRVANEDALLWAWRFAETAEAAAIGREDLAREQGWHESKAAAVLNRLQRVGYFSRAEDKFTLSDDGRKEAMNLIRRHRLYESYLSDVVGLSPDHIHNTADRAEHFIPSATERQLQSKYNEQQLDPHGKPIPEK
jgi:manganese/zinc/iron transport system permease protein